jgi:hypothetical protein
MFTLAGCSTIKSGALEASTATEATGLVYYLPIRTLMVDSKFTIQDCGLAGSHAALRYDAAPTVTSSITADRSHPYVITDGLDGKILKALNFEITQYENGTLKGVNVVADDRTAETATNVLSGALKFGLGLTGLTGFSAQDDTPAVTWLSTLDPEKDKARIETVRQVCGVDVTEALLDIKRLRKGLSGAREANEAKTKTAAALTEADKAVSEARAALKAANEVKGEEDMAQARQVLASAVSALVEARKKAETAPSATPATAINQDIAAISQRHLTYSASKLIIPDEAAGAIEKKVTYPIANLKAAGIPGANEDLVAVVELEPLAPDRDGENPPRYATSAHPSGSFHDGIWLRAPASASLQICVKSCDDTTSRLSQVVTVPQWGQLTRLPLKNMMFAKNTTKLSFAPDGTLLSLSGESTAAAERASAAFLQSGEALLDFATKRRALISELATAESASEKASIQQQLDVLELNQQLAAAQSTVGPERESQLSLLQFQIQQKQKQIELLELDAKLKALQAESEE